MQWTESTATRDEALRGAGTLNSMSFHLPKLIGPAAAGLMIAADGIGWAFLLNGASFFAVVADHVGPRRAVSIRGVASPTAVFLAAAVRPHASPFVHGR